MLTLYSFLSCSSVSDSTTQFLLAEHLANTAASEGEILTYLDKVQQHKPTVVLSRPLQPGMSALSLEEHRVLQSLDRLNQRLQSKDSVDLQSCAFETVPLVIWQAI